MRLPGWRATPSPGASPKTARTLGWSTVIAFWKKHFKQVAVRRAVIHAISALTVYRDWMKSFRRTRMTTEVQFDALLPSDMAAKVEQVGVRKANLDPVSTFV